MTERFNWQLHIVGPEGEETVSLPLGDTRVGRRPQNDVVLSHQFVSGQHALLTCTPAACTLTDLESTNGTTVAGEPVPANEPLPLAPGTAVTIGPFTLTLVGVPVEAEEAAQVAAQTAEAEPGTVSETAGDAPTPAEAIREAEPLPATGEQAAPAARPAQVSPPPPTPPPPVKPGVNGSIFRPDPAEPLPGLDRSGRRLLGYLPGIYHTDFMGRFLAIFESILAPVEWTVDNFDLFLSPRTAPVEFLPWLANWYTITYDTTWSEGQRRALLADAPQIYARRGTRWALARVLEIYTGRQPEIVEFEDESEPFSFTVRLPVARGALNVTLLEQIIDAHKPAHTIYRLRFVGE